MTDSNNMSEDTGEHEPLDETDLGAAYFARMIKPIRLTAEDELVIDALLAGDGSDE